MILISKETIHTTHLDGKWSCNSIGAINLSGICIQPEDNTKPVLVAMENEYSNNYITFFLSGLVVLPFKKNPVTLPIKGKVLGRLEPDGSLSVSECRGESELPEVRLTQDISLTNSMLVLSSCGYMAHLQLSGTVKFHPQNGEVAFEGILDAPVVYHVDDNDTYCGIHTILKDAAIVIGDSLKGEHGTIRFGLYSHPEKTELFVQNFDSDDEFLYQFDEPLNLGSISINGLPENPITISPELLAGRETKSRLLLSVFPAQIKTNYFGNEMILFVHGEQYNDPFVVNTSGLWDAHCSNNVFFHLCAPEDPSKYALCKGAVMIEGVLEGNGMDVRSLDLISTTDADVYVLPECQISRILPSQQIKFHLDENDSVDCHLYLPVPLQLKDTLVITSLDYSNTIQARLCKRGLFATNALVSADDDNLKGDKGKNTCVIISGDGSVITINE